ncbi:DUF6214 family protein [Streptomyces sp. NPDC006458]|uniref:DUF6214 family protein n=1 Tax=Streptomyces sp. NPDC006458 TaxID=3154302 RepID=UPI0033B07A06
MLEASFLNLSDRRFEDGAVSVWPAWEVRESEGATSWFQVRLCFADGARVDALAVVSAGCLSVEDVRAQPALSLADLTVLADWIEGPLSEAGGIEPREEDGAQVWPYGDEGAGGGEFAHGREDFRWRDDAPGRSDAYGPPARTEAGTEARLRAGEPAGHGDPDELTDPDGCGDPDDLADPDGFGAPGDLGDPDEFSGPLDDPAPRRARPAWPRGVEGRWLVAQEYRAAQEDGVDPVLAVMCATGHSRRRSLKLIAQARDIGFLTPRHARR